MRITFVLPTIELGGGTKAVFLFANYLKERKHDVSVIYPLIPVSLSCKGYKKFGVKRALCNLLSGVAPNWFDLKADLRRVPFLSERYIPDADIIVATWWETAYNVSRYGSNKGRKFYLAQHYETWGGPDGAVKNSYKLGLKIIVNSVWLKNILEREINVKTEALILHAPDRNIFYPEETFNKKDENALRVLMPFRKIPWKGDEDGIKAFEIAKKRYPHLQLVIFGPLRGEDIPDSAEFHLRPSNSELRRIYNSCDIFVFPSRSEGFGMPPLEAMACKCAVATTNVGAVPDYSVSGETALVSEPNDIDGLAQNIIRLAENRDERKKIAENGYNYTKEYTWEKATHQLETVFKQYI